MTLWIGLTGGIGSGKSQTAAEFATLGVPHIDADALSRSLSAEGGAALPPIRAAFGDGVFDSQGRLDRAALRDEVFRRPESKKKLEDIMLPLILAAVKTQQQAYSAARYGILDVPLLIEQPAFAALTDRILVVDVDEATQIRRTAERSGLGEGEIKRIIAAQTPRRRRLLAADDVIANCGTIAQLGEKVRRLHGFYREL
ncbi:dephospho-CoA kinase [Neisseria lisongii]|uniref:Dephospho-CoA kinase n=1 Tax=Neisseria lisongii TaxID=2912188 RepID=A0AAW5ASV5_9NEIS|nr:dephospho-CoA kinase [Neisseria lisongii]MCF7530080.1 dephospho-CoA kinase [Neisseria lisongii]